MSIRHMSAVWESAPVTGTDLLVLLALADFAGADGSSWPSIATLAKRARASEPTVRRSVRALAQKGLIEVEHRPGYSSRYVVLPVSEPLPEPAPEPPTPATDATPINLIPLSSVTPPERGPLSQLRHPYQSDTPVIAVTPEPKELTHLASERDSDVGGHLSSPNADESRDDVERLCQHLADRVEANGSKRPTIGKEWRDAARLMLDRDGRTEQQIHAAIDWCQDDGFWRANVRSMPTLRKQYDQLRLKAQWQREQRQPRTNGTDDNIRALLNGHQTPQLLAIEGSSS